MALQKRLYKSNETVITAENLNDIQDAIIAIENLSLKDGVGIQKIEQTTTSSTDGGTNVITITLTDGTKSTFNVKNGKKGSTGSNGSDGEDGISPTVTVTEITGGHRITITDVNGTKHFDVMDGSNGESSNGEDGISATHSWNGTVLTVTSASGTSSADLKGAKGDNGKSAYEYARDGGYKGTETDFAKLLYGIPFITYDESTKILNFCSGDLITFTIDGKVYQAKSDMTWAEWVDSHYDGNAFSYDLYVFNEDYMAVSLNNTLVESTWTIQSGMDYSVSSW